MLKIRNKIETVFWRNMAVIAHTIGRNDKVLQYMDRLVNKGAAGEKEWWTIGSVYMKEAQWDKAAKAFLRALEINRDNYLYIYWLGIASEKNGDEQKAETLYDEAIKRYGEFREAIYAKGQLRLKNGDYRQALSCFERCQSLNQNDPDILNHIGLCYLKTGETEKALQSLKIAVSLKPREAALLYNYAMTLIKLDKYREALEVLEKIADKDREPAVFDLLGYCYSMLRDYQKSIENYSAALDLEPGNQELKLNLASVYAKAGDNKKALEIFKVLISQNPKDYQLLNNLAWVYENMKEYKAAESQYYRSLAVSMGDPEIAYNLSCCLKKQHNHLEALDIVKHLKEISGWHKIYCSSVAETYEYLGEDRLAVEYYNKACGLEHC